MPKDCQSRLVIPDTRCRRCRHFLPTSRCHVQVKLYSVKGVHRQKLSLPDFPVGGESRPGNSFPTVAGRFEGHTSTHHISTRPRVTVYAPPSHLARAGAISVDPVVSCQVSEDTCSPRPRSAPCPAMILWPPLGSGQRLQLHGPWTR